VRAQTLLEGGQTNEQKKQIMNTKRTTLLLAVLVAATVTGSLAQETPGL